MAALYFSFHVDKMLMGIPAHAVIELTRTAELSRVPGAPAYIQGLINLRGKLALAVDLRKRMELAPNVAVVEQQIYIFLHIGAQLIGLLVDGVDEMFALDDGDFVASPIDLGAHNRALVTGAYRLPRGLLHILDVDQILITELEIA